MDINFDYFLEKFEEVNTFGKVNGHQYELIKPGEVITKMKVLDVHQNSPGIAHGGAIAGMMDAVLGVAALSNTVLDGNLVSTVEFKINYFKPIFLNDQLVGKGKVIRKGKSLVVSIGEIYRGEELVAHGQGTFNVYPISKRTTEKATNK